MSFKKSINNLRRNLMRGLTGGIGQSTKNKEGKWEDRLKIKRILVTRPNSRLGNQILITPLVCELSEMFPNAKIDLFVRGGLSNIIFQNYESVDRIISLPRKPFKELWAYTKVWISLRRYRFDLVFNMDRESASGRLSTQIANGEYKFFNLEDEKLEAQFEDYVHMAKFPIYNLRNYLHTQGAEGTTRPIPDMNMKLSDEELQDGRRVLEDYLKDKTKPTIAIYTYATGNKCYPPQWWLPLYEKMVAQLGDDYNIFEVLPVENVSQVEFRAPAYYSKDIREISAVIANCDVFIGADSGIMHLASASGTPTLGLFSVTNVEQYKPYNKGSRAIVTTTTNHDQIVAAIGSVLKG